MSFFAQETNYWFQNFGAVSSLKGGIESAGINNSAAIYYNPGALSFIEGDYFDGQADVLSLNVLNIENAGGNGVNLESVQLDVSPSIVVFSKQIESNPNLTYSVGLLTRDNHNYTFELQHEQVGNYLNPVEKEDVFQGHYKYENRLRESWIMGAISYKATEKIGLGVTTNLFVRTQDFFKSYNALAFHKNEYQNREPLSKVTSNTDQQKLSYRVMGFIFKPAISIDLSPVKLGVVLTTPSISMGILNNKSSRSQLSNLPDEEQENYYEANFHNFYSGQYQTPLSINIGAEYQLKRVKIALSSEWFSKINKYNLIYNNRDSESMKFPMGTNPNYSIPVMANKSIVNFGASVVYKINQSFSYIGSFRTDFSYFDNTKLDKNSDFIPFISDWDLYHFTSGLVFSIKNTRITFGADYAHGGSNSNQQLINMTSASQSNFLRGTIDNSASTKFHNLSLSIGLNVEIMNKKKK